MFKRREKRGVLEILQSLVYPRGGWGRAASYVGYRLRRLPDPPARIARGIAAGVFISFTPLFGFHFLAAALVALVIRANVLAAMLSTFVGNPLTFPLIAAISIELGERILGTESPVPLPQIFSAFSRAAGELWQNLTTLIITGSSPHWENLVVFFQGVFLPYLVGGVAPGAAAGVLAYFLTRPLIEAYQKRRARQLTQRALAREARAKGLSAEARTTPRVGPTGKA